MLTPTALASSVATQAECGWSVYQQLPCRQQDITSFCDRKKQLASHSCCMNMEQPRLETHR